MKYRPLAERLWSNVDRGNADECWLWQGAKNPQGYGTIAPERGSGRSTLRTHRVAFEDHYKISAAGRMVMHSCDTPACCNPRHLSLGDAAENNADRHLKGRSRGASHVGSTHPQATISEAQAREIFISPLRAKALAEQYGIKTCVVYDVWQRNNWRHATEGLSRPARNANRRAGSNFR